MRKTMMLAILLGVSAMAGAADPAARAAAKDPHARTAMMLSAVKAGASLVAVGANGYILLSDDDGIHYRQAGHVPVDFTLTGVSFADARNGWAVGHGGAVLHTGDGGEHWTVQRIDTAVDQPLYSVHFSDSQHGWAAGLWSLLIHTSDGGKSWTPVKLPAAAGQKRADLNLLKVFGAGAALYIAAEQGTLFRSLNNGADWQVVQTGINASLWSGTVTPAGTVLVGGLGGKLLRSTDQGATWQALASPTTASITGLLEFDGALYASALDGSVLQSRDDGLHWRVAAGARVALTALAPGKGKVLAYSKDGPVALTPK